LIITQLLALAWNVEAPGTVTVFVDDVELIADGVVSENVTTEYMPPQNMGGSPGDAPGGLDWIEGGPPSGPTPVEAHGQLHVAGGQLLDENDEPPMLQGQALAWDNWWPQYHNKDVVDWLRQDWCVDVVRPAMGIEPEGAYLDDPEASTARMTEVVEAAIESGIYVIVDWHAHDIHEQQAVAFFSMMAETYGDNPNIIYEIFNEPETEETWADIKAYADTVIAAIRVHDPNNVVIVGTPEWDQRIDLAAEDPITSDPNVVYAVHFYAGTHTAWLRTRVADALDAGVPIYISEHGGSEADGMGANDYDEWNEWLTFLDDNEIGWINWSIADKEGETVSLLQPGTPGTGGWTQEDLTRTGVHVRSLLRSYNCPND
jgi:endoglucanase